MNHSNLLLTAAAMFLVAWLSSTTMAQATSPTAPAPTPAPARTPSQPQTPGKPVESKPAPAKESSPKPGEEAAPVSPYVLGFKVKTIDGKEQDLSAYKGKVIVIVNVASKCGFTSQYKGLEELYQSKKSEGLVILGFPANNFGHQEPGTDSDIKGFCEERKVSFPLFSKTSVKGDDQHPLYKLLAAQPKPIGGAPQWNFTKFVVDRQGNVVARYDAEKLYAGTPDLEPKLLAKVDELLKQK